MTNVLEEIPRMDGIVIYAENVTVAKLGDDRFLILGKNNLKLVSYWYILSIKKNLTDYGWNFLIVYPIHCIEIR